MSSSTVISDLPDVAMLTIFDNLPLLDLLHIDEVCSKWKNMKLSALARRKQLDIVPYAETLNTFENPSFELLCFATNDDGSPSYPVNVVLDSHAIYVTEIITHQMLDKIIDIMPNLRGKFSEKKAFSYFDTKYNFLSDPCSTILWHNE